MITSSKCLIDNWSILQACNIIHASEYYRRMSPGKAEELFEDFGGFSNLINSLLLYEIPCYLANGNESAWKKNELFAKRVLQHLHAELPVETSEKYYSFFSSEDNGAKFYLLMSRKLDAELYISADRSNAVIKNGLGKLDNDFLSLLNGIDEKIEENSKTNLNKRLTYGIQQNFVLPSLTHYVLSQATSVNDLLDVIIQLRTSKDILKVKEKVAEYSENIRSYTSFQKEVERLLNKQFNKDIKLESRLSINIKVLFLTYTNSINANFPRRKSYLTYLKDIIMCRTETFGLKKQIKRVFNIELENYSSPARTGNDFGASGKES
jgi:hypothetical protein